MTTFDAGSVTLEKVRDCVWEIPQTGEMRVPARVLASERLLEEIEQDKTLQQLQNTTHLPGVQKYAVCMPDGHQGYGFPVGGVAALDAEDGCISPGAVGYDVNCLPGDTDVRLSFGRRVEIAALETRFEDERATVAGEQLADSPVRLFTESGDRTVHEVETATGERVEATGEHPFRTPDGMRTLDELEPGDTVHVQPFRGLEHEDPAEVTLLTVADVADERPQIRRALTERDILPLTTADESFNRLLKLVGYLTGDGSFGGDPEGLDRIREDVRAVGFEPSELYPRERNCEADGKGPEATGHSLGTTSEALGLLLCRLGVPDGERVASGFTTPWYFEHLTDWQKALYYSAYFGAEMSAPTPQHDGVLRRPSVSQNRTVETAEAGRQFLRDLAGFFADVGVESTSIEESAVDSDSERDVVRLRLGVENDTENLRRFFSTVGYRYSREKRKRAVEAIQYLKTEERGVERHGAVAPEARTLADGGVQAQEVGGDMTVETEVVSIEAVGQKPVYDIGVEHEAHNFLANEFVVSNCGVRMIRTGLAYDDLRGREAELVDKLFANIPTGLGGGGVYEGSMADVEAILERGMDWALEAGFAVESDLAHCEDEGRRPEGDAGAVSKEAKDRGKNQVGSLGSGNHFLEVQRVTDVYRGDVAEEFGLSEDQVVVLVHCGSRGLGHQVCTDYLREVEQTHQGLLETLPDKELAAAPAGSHLAEEYYRAMCAAINFAWVNRQLITHRTRQVFAQVFDTPWQDLGMDLLYDVAHNIAKREVHDVDGTDREVFVHRKGATRAFPAGHPQVPRAYRDVGQPIIIPGSMGAGSYVLRGGEQSLSETFGSTAHGAGRLMSRTQAKQEYWGEDVRDDLREQDHVYVKAQSGATVAEEAPGVYKDVDEVVRVSDALGIGDRVARTFPVCNIKG